MHPPEAIGEGCKQWNAFRGKGYNITMSHTESCRRSSSLRYAGLMVLLFSGVLRADPAPEALRHAALAEYAEQPQVVMYATRWCPYCQQARNYFRRQGIAYTEYDIESDGEARRRYQAFGGRGIPVIFVGKRRLDGFSESAFRRIHP